MARVFAPDDDESDFLREMIKSSRVQRNPQLQRQMIQLVGGAPEEPAPSAPKPQPLTGLIRSEKAMPRPSSGPPVPSLTPAAATGSGDARAAAINRVAQQIGANPLDLATVISYESAGKFSPSIYGGKGGRHLGLIQFGPAEQRKYGVHANQTFDEQMNAVGAYLKDRGFKPGMSREQLYSTINAGRPDRLGARDAAAGGAPGTVLDKVRTQMAGHEAKARKLLGTPASAALSSPPAAAPLAVTAPGPQAAAQPSSRDGRVQVASNDPSFVPAAPQTAVARAADTGAAAAPPLPPPRPPSQAFRTEQAGATPSPRPAPGSPLSPTDLSTVDQALAGTGPMGSLFKGLEGARLTAGEGFSYEPPGGQRSDAPLPPPRPQAFRTEQIGGSQGNNQLVGSAGSDTIRPPSGVSRDLGGAASAVPGVTVSTTPATGTQPATVTKVDPQTGGLRTYVLAGKDPGIVDRLNPQFSTGLQKLIESAPPEMRDAIRIRSAFRTPQEQANLYTAALQKYGSEQAARKFVAPPGHSRHEGGQAVDLDYGAPKGSPEYEARKNWVHQNAANYGLQFPMGHEPWHVEPVGSRGGRDASAKVLPPEAGGPALGQPMPEPRVTEMPPAASAAPEVNVTTPMSEADLAAGAGGGDSGLGGLLGGLAKGLGGGSSGGNLNAERTMSPGMGQGYDDKLGAASKAALGAQPLFGNIGDLAKTRQLSKMFDLQDLGQIGQPQLARRKLGFGL
jgi:D-alanyl-D-alanine carboxypeptidase